MNRRPQRTAPRLWLSGVVMAMSALVAVPLASAAPAPVPGADESPAILRETNAELGNPGGPDRMPEVKSRAAGAISVRQNRLATLTKSINNGAAKKFDCAQVAVTAQLAAEATALNTLGQKLAGETEVKKAKESYRKIFTDSRVYVLHNSRTYLVAQCFDLQQRAQRLSTRLAEVTNIDATETARLGGVLGQVANDSRTVLAPVLALVPDKGDKAALAANIATLNTTGEQMKTFDASLDDIESILDPVATPAAPATPKQNKRKGNGQTATTTVPVAPAPAV